MDSGNPLLKAVFLRRLRLTRLLLEGGAYVNESDGRGHTPLMTACRTQHSDTQSASRVKLVHFLLEKGADPNIQDKDGRSALMHACREQAGPEVVSLLLENGADISLEDRSGTSALVYAVMAGDRTVLKLLLDSCKAKGKEVIIITTDKFPCGELPAKQYLAMPTIDRLDTTDGATIGPASPSEIQLITSPKCNSSSSSSSSSSTLRPPQQVFSFKDVQTCGGVSSHPGSPLRFKRQGQKAPHGLQQPLLRLNSEPWLKIPSSMSHPEKSRNIYENEDLSLRVPTIDLGASGFDQKHYLSLKIPKQDADKSTICTTTKDSFRCHGRNMEQNEDGSLRIPTIDKSHITNLTTDNFDAYEEQLVRERQEEEEAEKEATNNKEKISLPGLTSSHSASHPNLHSGNIRADSITASSSFSNVSTASFQSMTSSSLQSIIQRRKLGSDVYRSDPQLAIDLQNLSEKGLKDLITESTKLAHLRCSSTMGSRESVWNCGPKKRVFAGLERRGSGAFLLDQNSQMKPRSLPPLTLNNSSARSQFNVQNVGSYSSGLWEKEVGVKGLIPSAPPGHPRETMTKRMLLRRHSMQTEQFKTTA